VLPAGARGLQVLGDRGGADATAAAGEGDRLDPLDLGVEVGDRRLDVAAGEGFVGGEDDLDLGVVGGGGASGLGHTPKLPAQLFLIVARRP
jgi:hypothetical protein